MPKNWHHFSFKEHVKFLSDHGFTFAHSEGSHFFYVRKVAGEPHRVVQSVKGDEEKRQSRRTMDMSSRHSGISKAEYKTWINA